jgi:pimeloyl-ACP methyl ester carboxylesterase
VDLLGAPARLERGGGGRREGEDEQEGEREGPWHGRALSHSVDRMTTFALVHGAWHGAWCWERLLEPLERRGHGAVAMDLPAEDPEAGLDAYADTVAAFLAPYDDAIVVGHSLNGLILPLVAARRPVAALVYLCAFLPLEGKSFDDQLANSTLPILIFADRPARDDRGRSYWPDLETARRGLYADLSEEDAAWAFPQLRPQAPASQREEHPHGLPDVPAVSIIGAADGAVNPEWSRVVARERLGAPALELDTGHFPMITAPEALADALDAVSSAA